MKENKHCTLAFFVFIFLGLFFRTNLFAQSMENPPAAYSAQAVKAFADSLFSNGFFDEAENEYRRFLFINQDKNCTLEAEALVSLSQIFFLEKNKTGAQKLFEKYSEGQNTETGEKLTLNYARLIFAERSSDEFAEFFQKNITLSKEFSEQTKFLLSFSNLILQKKIPDAVNLCTEFSQTILNESFKSAMNVCLSYKTKNPGLALFLSAILPGAGKCYTGSFRGGLSSFIYVGGFTTGAVYSALKFGWQDWRPYTFGTAAVFLYAAELYGAYKSAQRYNQNAYFNICRKTDELYEDIF